MGYVSAVTHVISVLSVLRAIYCDDIYRVLRSKYLYLAINLLTIDYCSIFKHTCTKISLYTNQQISLLIQKRSRKFCCSTNTDLQALFFNQGYNFLCTLNIVPALFDIYSGSRLQGVMFFSYSKV